MQEAHYTKIAKGNSVKEASINLYALSVSPVQAGAPAAARSPPLGAVVAAVLVPVETDAAPAVGGGEAEGAVLAVDGGVGAVRDGLDAAGGGLHRLQRVTLVPSDRAVVERLCHSLARLCSTQINMSFETDSEKVLRPVDTQKVSSVSGSHHNSKKD